MKQISRKNLLERNSAFAKFILDIQENNYNPANDPYKPGEMYVENEKRYISQEECDQFNREEAVFFDEIKDKPAIDLPELSFSGEIVAELNAPDIHSFAVQLGECLGKLTADYFQNALLIISEFPVPYLHGENDYEPVAQAVKNLQEAGISKGYNGGITANSEEAAALMPDFFWLARCNASLPQVYFTGSDSTVFGTLCQHGNVHFKLYSDEEKNRFEKALADSGFLIAEDNRCREQFAESGAVEERKLEL